MRRPARLAEEWRHEGAWLATLPDLVADWAEQWDLALEAPVDTPHSLVVPAGDVVLKLNAPGHAEAEHEADALARWDGRGAVRLLARDDTRRARSSKPRSTSTGASTRPGTHSRTRISTATTSSEPNDSRGWSSTRSRSSASANWTGGWRVAHALAWGWDERDGWSEWSVESARLILGA